METQKVIETLTEEAVRHIKIALVCVEQKLKDNHMEIATALSTAVITLRHMMEVKA